MFGIQFQGGGKERNWFFFEVEILVLEDYYLLRIVEKGEELILYVEV